jgi:hypothetical protein
MKIRFFILLICSLLLGKCYAQAYLDKTISQVKEKMKEDFSEVEIQIFNNNAGGKTLAQKLPDIQHMAFFNKNGICNLEKIYPLTDEATAKYLLLIQSMAYVNYYDRSIDIHTYKIRVEGKGIIKADFLVDDKGYYVFELYFINSLGKRIK